MVKNAPLVSAFLRRAIAQSIGASHDRREKSCGKRMHNFRSEFGWQCENGLALWPIVRSAAINLAAYPVPRARASNSLKKKNRFGRIIDFPSLIVAKIGKLKFFE